VRVREGDKRRVLFSLQMQFYQELQKLHTKGEKKNSAPYKKRKRQSLTANQKSQTFFVICPLVFEAKKPSLDFYFF
jgi:hypothetical protein